ncbi:Aminopeptidase N [Holothuria leucospilota]|uniref:Aminopeptidase N n=1 Tax=Holothuria leucospilota TaxID=206669 RepID=A0A9Q1C062_HOLLE|nr:Aminopeptidase N [Holothuria leucospilota]
MSNKRESQLEFAESESSGSGSTSKDGIYCTTGTIVFCAIAAVGLIVGVGLIAYYVPDRTCSVPDKPTGNPQDGFTSKRPATSPGITEAPKSPTPSHSKGPTEPPSSVSATPPPTPTDDGVWEGRLNGDIMYPRSYDLTLKPCLYFECGEDMRFRFYGWVEIVVVIEENTDRIVMHMANIDVDGIKVRRTVGDQTDLFVSHEEDTLYEFLIIHTRETLMKGTDYRVYIEYRGNLTNGLAGFYRSSYVNADGETVWLATSQMQPTDGRRALPCWDEPGFRSYFDTKIIHMSNMTALSNGIELGTETYEGDWQITTFKTTPKMPTYLLAFIVSDFGYKEGYTKNGVRFRVWCRKEAINTTDYALQQGVDILTYFEEYFSIPFPLEKQDMVAVPDFSAGAMENWGLIIYRETALLFDPMQNSAANKQRVAVVVSHELAHQWFGNLVTPEWWDDLWLNEGFASYVEYLGVNFTEPTWKMMEQFLVEDLQSVFSPDSLGSSHPVRVPVSSPAEINEIFDRISYAKGASILRMLNNILTEDVFRSGLLRYLNHYAEGNANSDKLWDALNQAQDVYDVKAIMDTWTLQMGFPVVNMTRNGNMLTAIQKHFLINPDSEVDDKYGDLGYLWYIQLTHTHKSQMEYENPNFDWMNGTSGEILTFSLEQSVKNTDWYLINIKQYGYYRVNYDLENWERLMTQLEADLNAIPAENRAALIDDAFDLARSGALTYDIPLGITKYLKNELEYIPWEATLVAIAYIRNMFSRNAGYGNLEKYMLCQIESLYNSVGFEDNPNDELLDQYNRVNAVGTACFYGHQGCLENATREFMEYMTMNETVSPNLKTSVYCYGIREGGADEWDFGLKKYQESTNAAEKATWLYALSCSREPWILSRYLSYSLNEDIVRQQDASYVIRYTARNYVGRALAWDYLRSEWDAIFAYFGEGSFTFSNIIAAVTAHFNTEFDLQELEKFGEGRDFGSATRAFSQAIDATKANIEWMNRNAETVSNTLAQSLPDVCS